MANFANLADVQKAYKEARKLGYFTGNALKKAVEETTKK